MGTVAQIHSPLNSSMKNNNEDGKKGYVKQPFSNQLFVHGLITHRDPKLLRNYIYSFPLFGLFVALQSWKTFHEQLDGMKRVINEDGVLGKVLEDYNAEHDGTFLRIYHYASAEMLSWKDSKLVSSVQTFMSNEIHSRFIEGGAGNMYASKIDITANKMNANELSELRGYIQSEELRCVIVTLYPTYFGTTKAVIKTTIEGFIIHLIVYILLYVFVLFLI